MSALIAIVWFIAVIIAILAVKEFSRMEALVRLFPEGRRWWIFPSFLASLTAFGLLARFNPIY